MYVGISFYFDLILGLKLLILAGGIISIPFLIWAFKDRVVEILEDKNDLGEY